MVAGGGVFCLCALLEAGGERGEGRDRESSAGRYLRQLGLFGGWWTGLWA